MRKRLRRFYAQNAILDAFNHRTKYCLTLQDAREFLRQHGGGTISDAGSRGTYKLIEIVASDGQIRTPTATDLYDGEDSHDLNLVW